MRLLFVCPDMRTGGAERHWATVTALLRERGAEVGVLCLSDEGDLYAEVARAGVATACLHMRSPLDPRGVRRALGFARPRPDVVVSRGVTGLLVGAAIAHRARAPHVVNEHTPLLASGELLPMQPHQRALTRLAAPHVDQVIAVARQQVEPLTRLGYRHERIEVIANGIAPLDASAGEGLGGERTAVDASQVAPLDASPGGRLAGDGEFAVLCAARLQVEKRADRFVHAVAAARDSEPRIRGFLAGDGSERAAIERAAAGSGVTLLGERSDVPALLRAADAFVLTSDAEALPISILEAMAAGVPVIAPDLGGVSELVVHGETGLLVPPGDVEALKAALVELAADPARARRMGEAGRARQRQRFDAAAMTDAYLAAFDRVVRGD